MIRLLVLFSMLGSYTFSQIEPWDGIHDTDNCTFELDCNWIHLDTSALNIWQIGTPEKPFFDTAYSIPNAIVTDTINPYPITNHSYFDVKLSIYQQYYDNLIIGFRHKFQTDTLIDGGYIEVSYDDGETWNNVLYEDTVNYPDFFTYQNLYNADDTLKGGIHGFSGTSDEWIYTRIQWVWEFPIKKIAPDNFIIRFNFISDEIQTNKDGWMIDNIVLSFAKLPGSIAEFDNQNIQIFPNPFDEFALIKIENTTSEPLNLSIYNSLGKEIRFIDNIITNEIQIEKKDLTSGMYYVELKNRTEIIGTSRLVVK